MISVNVPEHGLLLAEEAKVGFNPFRDVVISRSVDGELLGGVIFTGFTGASMSLHMAGFAPNWASKDMVWMIFHYPFVQCGCARLFAQVPVDNQHAMQMNIRLGFEPIYRVEGVYLEEQGPGSGDLIVLKMEKANCKWLKIKPSSIAPVTQEAA